MSKVRRAGTRRLNLGIFLPGDSKVNLQNALELEPDDVQDEIEDLAGYFINIGEVCSTLYSLLNYSLKKGCQNNPLPLDKLYFFQFPGSFPSFVAPMLEDGNDPPPQKQDKGKARQDPQAHKRVSFAANTKRSTDCDEDISVAKLEGSGIEASGQSTQSSGLQGHIGQLEIYESGAVKMRIGNVLMDVRRHLLSLLMSNAYKHLGHWRNACVVSAACRACR